MLYYAVVIPQFYTGADESIVLFLDLYFGSFLGGRQEDKLEEELPSCHVTRQSPITDGDCLTAL